MKQLISDLPSSLKATVLLFIVFLSSLKFVHSDLGVIVLAGLACVLIPVLAHSFTRKD